LGKPWIHTAGTYGVRVRVAERRFGGSVYATFPRPDGQRRWKSLGFRVRDSEGRLLPEAIRKAKRIAVQISNRVIEGELPVEHVLSLGELFDLFRYEVVAEKTGTYQHEVKSALEFWESYLGRGFRIARFGPREWNAARRDRETGARDCKGHLISDPEVRKTCRPRSVAKSLTVLRHACRFGTHYRRPDGSFLLDVDPTRGLPLPKEKNPARPICDDERFERLLAVADRVPLTRWSQERSYLRELLILAGFSGRRIGAIVSLRWSDWFPDDGANGMLRWRADSDKLGREWRAPLSPEVRQALEDLKTERPGVGEAWVFPSPRGSGHLSTDVARNWLLAAEKLAGLVHPRGFGWHSLRRRWATQRKHLPVQDVAAVGGWSQVQVLQELYQRPDIATMEDVVNGGRPLRTRVAE